MTTRTEEIVEKVARAIAPDTCCENLEECIYYITDGACDCTKAARAALCVVLHELNIVAVFNPILDYAQDYQDDGPSPEGWKSEEAKANIKRAEELLTITSELEKK